MPRRRPHHRDRAGPMRAARIVAAGVALVFAFTGIYVAAYHSPRAHGYELGVVGSPAQADRAQDMLDAHDPGAFDVRRYRREGAARHALLDTDVHGVLVPGATRDRLLLAGALGAAPTQMATGALRSLGARSGRPVAVQDLRPLSSKDPRGLASLFTVLGTLIPSLIFGVLLATFGRSLSDRARAAAVAAYALLAGLVAAFNADVLTGALEGHFLGLLAVSGLFALAVSATAHGLASAGRLAGIGAAVAVLMLLGVSSAGGAVGYELEPGFYGAISQLLPPGAALTALRNAQYFDWSATLAPMAVLGAWAAAGLAVGLLPGTRAGAEQAPRAAPVSV